LRPPRRALSVRIMKDTSPDHDERLSDFFARHGGAAARPVRHGQSAGGLQGWSEVYASDGYALRSEWSTIGTLEEMKYSEISPTEIPPTAGL
jgi:hypothetical protein